MEANTDEDRIEIAKEFVSRHKNPGLTEFYDEDQWLSYYFKLAGGVFSSSGEAYRDGMPCEFQVEIQSHETKSGHTELFDWEDEEYYNIVNSPTDCK